MEVVAGHGARAGARHENAAGLQEADRDAIDAMVGPQGVVDRRSAAGELGRIEHNHPKPLPCRGQRIELLEGIHRLDGDVGGAIQVGVGPRQRRRLIARVDRQHAPRAARHGAGHGEAARVAEHVEHAATAGMPGSRLTVVSLVEVVARLLPLGEVHTELEAVLMHEDRARRGSAADHPVGHRETLELRQPPLRTPQQDSLRRQRRSESVADRLEAGRNRQRRHLHGEVVAVAIDDQAGQVIPLAVHQASRTGRVIEAEVATQGDRRCEPPVPEGVVELRCRVERIETDPNPTPGVPEAAGHEVPIVRGQIDHVAVSRAAFDLPNGGVEHPGVAAEEGPGPLWLESHGRRGEARGKARGEGGCGKGGSRHPPTLPPWTWRGVRRARRAWRDLASRGERGSHRYPGR